MAHGGGAGKVYFVLYLAVVLELLIIIVERDEAEEGLHKKNKETMRIVESILSQLYSGSGSEGINTRPQDEITIPQPGINYKEILGTDIKSWRQYIIEVGVTDISTQLKKLETESDKEYYLRLYEMADRSNVEELEYQLFYNPSEELTIPYFPSQDELRDYNIDDFSESNKGLEIPGRTKEEKSGWRFIGYRMLKLDNEKTKGKLNTSDVSITSFEPIYNIIDNSKAPVNAYKPDEPGMTDSLVFAYSLEKTLAANAVTSRDSTLKKRAFIVNFKPPYEKGWYKLRFVSRTNQILGVRKEVDPLKLDEESAINIGSVKLKVKDLMKVQRELQSKLDEYNLPGQDVLIQDPREFKNRISQSVSLVPQKEDRLEIISQIRLYSYISRLLAPGAYRDFDQNQGAIEFDVRLITPKTAEEAKPTIFVQEIHRFDAAKQQVFEFKISPERGADNKISGELLDETGSKLSNISIDFQTVNVSSDVRTMRGIINGPLGTSQDGRYRQYKLHLVHALGSVPAADTTVDFYVFPAIVERSNELMTQDWDRLARYGKIASFNFEPSSGKKIPEEQFRIYVKLDDRIDSVNGYIFSDARNFKFTADAQTASLRICWIDPITKDKIDIYPEYTVAIRQEPPTISFNSAKAETSGSDKQIVVRVSNITINPPITGTSDATKEPLITVDAQIDDPKVQGFRIVGKPAISKVGNSYTVQFQMSGTIPPAARGKISGTAKVVVNATAKNPVSGKESKPCSKSWTINIDHRPKK